MKCTIPEISWHNKEPVLSVDIHPISNGHYRLASGGVDSHILIWQLIISENGSVKQELVSDLTRHQRSVNIVRWSPSGQYLASADDDANIIVWQLKNDNIPLLEGDTDDKEIWIVYKVLRGHKEDIYDLCWSVDNTKLLSGSVDNTAVLWDLTKGKMDHIMSDHKGFVQGVAWDPKNQILATISTDRICRIFDVTGKHVKSRIHKGKLPVPNDHFLYEKECKFFYDDTFKSFFRRLQFTPDGSLLIVPSGHFQDEECKKIINSSLIFTLDNWAEPAAILPLDNQSSTTVRCCPLLFCLRDDGPESLVNLPYRMIFAVGTDHDIILYDTQQTKPFARFHEIHYTRITDLTWSADGLILIASSTDGFCTIITFEQEELGKVYTKEESDDELSNMECSEIPPVDTTDKDENVDITNKTDKEETKKEVKKRPSFIQQWVQNTPKKAKVEKKNVTDCGDIIELDDDEDNDDEKPKELSKEIKDEIHKLLPRRIAPIKIDEVSKSSKTEAKPIEVRRKPREIENNETNVSKTELKDIRSDAKPIEVRRKPRAENSKPNEAGDKKDEAKPIEVRRKPKEENNKPSESEEKKVEAKPIEVRRKSKEEEIKSNEAGVQKMEAKPIEARRKPKEEECSKSNEPGREKVDENPTVEANNKSSESGDKKIEAKPIEVRRKPRELTNTQSQKPKAASTIINMLIPRRITPKKVEDNVTVKPNDDKDKILKVVLTPFNLNDISHNTTSKDDCTEQISNDKIDSSCEEKTEKNTSNSPEDLNSDQKSKEEIIVLDDNSKDKEVDQKTNLLSTPSKKTTNTSSQNKSNKKKNVSNGIKSKNKNTSSVTNSSITPSKPTSSTSMSSADKKASSLKKKDPPKIKVGSLIPKKLSTTPSKSNPLLDFLKKSSDKKKNKPEPVIAQNVDLTLDDIEARDGFGDEVAKKNVPVVPDAVPMEDDFTEDFCLQLEDTQDDKTDKQSECKKMDVDKVDVDQNDAQINRIIEVSDESSSPKQKKTDENVVQKMPRRVPLITLASPKGKKKPSTTEKNSN
ncbi:chromatin assembly factor 1 subunit B [Diabrotica virgifera virgifera]|uniref:CAF1B/HIR1 beta-propeller domain-containing protein n=2 Tax=Diabrotica virgifera virgifera TaxID=50390 RepID=A0ABM5KA12_DIAVI|nr:chromatin assembly factor 1 subunit B [Diabrotica virgifera virgifera]